ncbi:MAG: TonB-dependent receptor [Burkholderiales bacterium]|nr:TonB-dependent receptor [Burkholderiales bacterium]
MSRHACTSRRVALRTPTVRLSLRPLNPLIALLIAGAAGTVFAAGEPRVDKIDVTAPAGREAKSDTASEGTVSKEQLEHRPIARPGEVLEAIPGLIVTQHSGGGKANQYFLRGFNLDHGTDFRTTLNGMPLNHVTHAHGQGYTDVNFLIPELIERIVYKKGPYYAEEGDFSSAGAADIEYVRKLGQSSASLEIGQRGYRRLFAALGSTLGPGNLVIGIEGLRNDGPWEVPESLDKKNLMLRYSFAAMGGKASVMALSYRNKWNSNHQVPQRALDSGLISRFGNLDDSDGGDTRRDSLSADWQWMDESGYLNASVFTTRYTLDLFSNFTYFAADPVRGDQFEQIDRRRVHGASVERGFTHGLGPVGKTVESTTAIGVQLRRDDIDQVGLFGTTRRARHTTFADNEVKQSTLSAHLRNTTQWTPWLRSVAGARIDEFKFDVKSFVPANSGVVKDSIVSPKLALVFGPFDKTEFFASAGRSFHSNDARGTTITVDPATGDPLDKVNPLVKSRGAELGLRTELGPVQITAALWHLKLDSELLFVGDAGTTEATRPSKRKGIELSAFWSPKRGIYFDADVALSRARFSDSATEGEYIPGSIERTASLGVTFDDDRPWFGGLRIRHFGARPLIEDNSVRSPSSTLASLKLGYKLDRRARIAFEVINLFDRKVSDIDYLYESRLRGEADPVTDIHTHPVEPRTLRLMLTYKF